MIKTSFKRAWQSSALLFAALIFSATAVLPALVATETAYAGNGGDFSLQPGSSPEAIRAVADAWDDGDNYNMPGWGNIAVYYKGPYLGGAKRMQYNATLTKEMADGADGRAAYTATYWCSVPDHKITFSPPANNQPYYEVVYGVVLEDENGNESSGDKFIDQNNFAARGGVLITRKATAAGSGNISAKPKVETTHDITDGVSDYSKIDAGDDYEALGHDGKAYDDDDDKRFGIDEADRACRPPAAVLGSLSISNYNKLSDAQKEPFKEAATAASGATSGSGDDQAGSDDDIECDTKLSNPLTWFICPVIDMLTGMITFIDGQITKRMNIDTNRIFCDRGGVTNDEQARCDAFYQAWSSFRNIALGLMVLVGLIILISQTLGMEILDAYTIRKALPRLLIAAMFITLSWPLMGFAVQFTNDLGYGLRNLIYAPFSGLGSEVDLDFNGEGGMNIFVGSLFNAIAVPAAAVWLIAGGAGILLSAAVTAALAVLIAILVLVLREIAIIMLILIAPIMILAFVLPNTQKAYNLWWESFSKALLMFPLIAIFIAIGHVMAAIAFSSGDFIDQFIGFIAYFAPYFLIPLTFKFAGGLVRQLGGFVNDRGKGAFDRLAKYRANRRQQMAQDVKSRQALRVLGPGKKGGVRDRINTGLQAASMAGSAGINPRYWRGNVTEQMRKYDAQRRAGSDNEEEMATINGYDDLARAVTETGGNLNEMDAFLFKRDYDDQSRKQMLTAWTVARKGMEKKGYSHDAILQSVMLSGLKAKTAYRDKYLDYDDDGNYIGGGRVAADIAKLSGGNRGTMAQMVGRAAEITKAAGRQDEMPGFSDTFEAVAKLSAAAPEDRDDLIKAQSRKLLQKSIYKEGLSAMVGGTAHATRHLTPVFRETLRGTVDTLNMIDNLKPGEKKQVNYYDEVAGKMVEETVTTENAANVRRIVQRNQNQVAAQLLSLQEVNGNLPPEKQALVANLLNEKMGEAEDGTPISVQQFINNKRVDPEVNQFRSDYRYISGSDSEIEARANAARNRGGGPGDPGIMPPGAHIGPMG